LFKTFPNMCEFTSWAVHLWQVNQIEYFPFEYDDARLGDTKIFWRLVPIGDSSNTESIVAMTSDHFQFLGQINLKVKRNVTLGRLTKRNFWGLVSIEDLYNTEWIGEVTSVHLYAGLDWTEDKKNVSFGQLFQPHPFVCHWSVSCPPLNFFQFNFTNNF